MTRATGQFEVKMTPVPLQDSAAGTLMGRMTIDKNFTGDLVAHSMGEMLSAMTAVPGSAGYLAIEKVVGQLNGGAGSFVLQHSGTMNRGQASLVLTVVPDSGTDQLVGLTGSMSIKIEERKHFYEFEYQLNERE